MSERMHGGPARDDRARHDPARSGPEVGPPKPSQPACVDDELLQRYAENIVSPDEARAVKAHLAACAACRSALGQYKQIMWDLAHPAEIEIPEELEAMYQPLMEAWRKERESAKEAPLRGLIPAWAVQSLSWTRYLPWAFVIRALASRSRLARLGGWRRPWARRKGDEGH